MKLSDFVPKGQENNRKALVSAAMIMKIDATVFVVSTILIFVFKWMNFEAGVLVCYFSSFAAALHPVLMYFFDKITIPVYFFSICTIAIFFTLSLFSGGLNSSFAFWLITVAPIGMFYLKKREAIFWCSLALVVFISLPLIEYLGYLPANQLANSEILVINFVNVIGVCLVFMYIVSSFKSAYRKITSKLATVNKRLEHSNSELEKFASVASHDLKSPLRNISGFLKLLKRKEDQYDEKTVEFLDIIDSNARSMTQLIEDILEYSRTSGTTLKKEKVDLNKAVSQIKSQISNTNVFPNAIIKMDKLPIIVSDKTRLHQVFQNLVENGLKYNRSEKPKVEVRYHQRNKQHHFEFMDNGIGIDAKHSAKIFEMFQRLHGQSEFSGSGIGLATTKKNVEILGGSINFISVPGRGSTFRINFPIGQEDFMPSNKEIKAQEASV